MSDRDWERTRRGIIACTACPRLRKYCQSVAKIKRRAYAAEDYWGKPIPGFGDLGAGLVVVGLAPAAHGANRTGRIFTGDNSGKWLYRALHRAGFANQPSFERADDGLQLRDAYVTCVVKCAPPGNKPLPIEMRRCGKWLEQELAALRPRHDRPRVWLALGQIGLNGIWPFIARTDAISAGAAPPRKPKFAHAGECRLPGGDWLLMSYHPSQQNTFTGRLTEAMFDRVFARARGILGG